MKSSDGFYVLCDTKMKFIEIAKREKNLWYLMKDNKVYTTEEIKENWDLVAKLELSNEIL